MVATMTNEQLIAELRQRVEGLYRVNAELAAQVDRMRPVVDAACKWSDDYDDGATKDGDVLDAVTEYYGAMAQLAKGGTG